MNRLKDVIHAQGRTVVEVAEAAGLAAKTVYNAANGRKTNKATRRLLALALNTPETELFPGNERRQGVVSIPAFAIPAEAPAQEVV